ncbi:MAG: hypothetical protein J5594_04765 [Elusimicrobiaceae bacterium]|nr:hypothetical protein [Elusimicrobiaceae bacterium]
MGKRIKNYVENMMQVSNKMRSGKGVSKKNKEEILREMLVQIKFFQHERLIHVIVTVLFALLTIFTIACSCFLSNSLYGILFCLLSVLCLTLLIPYIYHYYVLENGVQKLYEIYDKIKNGRKVSSSSKAKGKKRSK